MDNGTICVFVFWEIENCGGYPSHIAVICIFRDICNAIQHFVFPCYTFASFEVVWCSWGKSYTAKNIYMITPAALQQRYKYSPEGPFFEIYLSTGEKIFKKKLLQAFFGAVHSLRIGKKRLMGEIRFDNHNAAVYNIHNYNAGKTW